MKISYPIQILFGLILTLGIQGSKIDLYDNELHIDYQPENEIENFTSKMYNLNIELITKNNFVEALIDHEKIPDQDIIIPKCPITDVKVFGIYNEPSEVFFNNEKLNYLNWYYLPEEKIIEIVDINYDISYDFNISWNN